MNITRFFPAVVVTVFAAVTFVVLPNYFLLATNPKYQLNDPVNLWVNGVGSPYNPQERYPYYSLPYCKPTTSTTQAKRRTLGERLMGDELRYAGYDIRFGKNQQFNCTTLPLTRGQANQFRMFVKDGFYGAYQMNLEGDFPVGDSIGTDHHQEEIVQHADFPEYRVDKVISKIYTIRDLVIGMNDDRNEILWAENSQRSEQWARNQGRSCLQPPTSSSV